jgi:two-component system phosphate regulon sensor histidine kinase PhoR
VLLQSTSKPSEELGTASVNRNHLRLFWWIFPTFAIVSLFSVFLVVSLGIDRSRNFFLEREHLGLGRLATIFSENIKYRELAEEKLDFKKLTQHFAQMAELRVTIIRPEGKVLADSHQDPNLMVNHQNRPELLDAMTYGKGSSSRFSNTLKTRMIYASQLITLTSEDVLIRLALPIPYLDKEIQSSISDHFQTAMAIMALGTIIVWFLTKRITKPIEKLTKEVHQISHGLRDRPLDMRGSLELGQLTHAINLMFRHSKERIHTIVQQRNQQESILTSMKEGVISLNHHGDITTMNPKARHIFYCSPSLDVIGRDLSEICRSSLILEEVAELRNTGKEFDREITVDAFGETTLQVRGCTIVSEGQTNNSYLIVINDITHLRRLENMRRDFVANVSHELKTPLTSIRGYSETLGGMDLFKSNDLALRFLGKIEHNADRLHRIIEDLLVLSRIEQSGLSPHDLKARSPKSIVDQLLQELKEDERQRISLPHKVDISKVLVHGPLIHQALFNLIDNALKYSGAQGIVDITLEEKDNKISFGIHDNGQGIPIKYLPMLTQRFYRVDKARSRDEGGTGLGLSIVKHIVEAHHGELDIKSSVGEGSSFIIRLPAATT